VSERWFTVPDDLRSDYSIYSESAPAVWSIDPKIFQPIWDQGITGEGVYVCVCDTGYSAHPAVKTPSVSRNFTSSGSGSSDVTDRNGHGTHCCGTVLGAGGIGVAPEAFLMVAKVLGDNGSGSTTWINQGLKWAAENGADITSRSLGGSQGDSDDVDAINSAYEAGLLIDVCAAGNSGFSGRGNTIGYPARYDLGVCVGATRRDGLIANFSSGGPQMDVACPGEQIISASYRGGYVAMSGTSMATPFMAGLLALVICKMRKTGRPVPKGPQAWLEFLKTQGFLEDRGSPGFDPLFGNGYPLVDRILVYLEDPNWI